MVKSRLDNHIKGDTSLSIAKNAMEPAGISLTTFFGFRRCQMKAYAGIDLHSSNNYVGIIDENDKRLYGKRMPNETRSGWRIC